MAQMISISSSSSPVSPPLFVVTHTHHTHCYSNIRHIPQHPFVGRADNWALTTAPNFRACVAAIQLRASDDDSGNDTSATRVLQQQPPNQEVEDSIKVLKNAAKTRKVDKNEILSALLLIEKAKLDPSNFLETLGGTKSPGRTWMLMFTAEKNLKGGRFFPLTAVQRFDAEAKRIENGIYLGPLGSLSFEGRFSWKNRILAFVFECVRIKVGPFNPLQITLGNQDNREPNTKDPFFIWFYIDEEIAVARGRSGGTAFWCRCQRVTSV